MKKIVQKDAPVLREISKEVPVSTINSPKIQKVLSEMKSALASQDDGVAIAAPQIGYPLRIFVVSHKVRTLAKPSAKTSEESSEPNVSDSVYINPTLKKASKDKSVLEEGCLSVRYLYGKVSRSNKATVEAYDENGKKFTRGGTGLLAQIFQHEIDHLNGILFIDKAKFLEEVIPEHLANKSKNNGK